MFSDNGTSFGVPFRPMMKRLKREGVSYPCEFIDDGEKEIASIVFLQWIEPSEHGMVEPEYEAAAISHGIGKKFRPDRVVDRHALNFNGRNILMATWYNLRGATWKEKRPSDPSLHGQTYFSLPPPAHSKRKARRFFNVHRSSRFSAITIPNRWMEH